MGFLERQSMIWFIKKQPLLSSICTFFLFGITHINNHQSLSSDLFALSILSPSFSQQKILRQMQRIPTRVMTEEATRVMISKVERESSKLEIMVSGMTPAQILKIPLPKQLQKKRMFLMTNPILHSMARMISPERPIYPGITYLSTTAFLLSCSESNPQRQQQTEKARKAAPTMRFRNFKMYVTSDRSFLFFFTRDLDSVGCTLSSSSLLLTFEGSDFSKASLESLAVSMKI